MDSVHPSTLHRGLPFNHETEPFSTIPCLTPTPLTSLHVSEKPKTEPCLISISATLKSEPRSPSACRRAHRCQHLSALPLYSIFSSCCSLTRWVPHRRLFFCQEFTRIVVVELSPAVRTCPGTVAMRSPPSTLSSSRRSSSSPSRPTAEPVLHAPSPELMRKAPRHPADRCVAHRPRLGRRARPRLQRRPGAPPARACSSSPSQTSVRKVALHAWPGALQGSACAPSRPRPSPPPSSYPPCMSPFTEFHPRRPENISLACCSTSMFRTSVQASSSPMPSPSLPLCPRFPSLTCGLPPPHDDREPRARSTAP
nr:uncharacterized protein LOC127333532 [Lolium perenne]